MFDLRNIIPAALARFSAPVSAPAPLATTHKPRRAKAAPAAPAAPAPVNAPDPARDIPRHAPADFPFPVWTDADVERYRAARAKGCSDVTGHRLVKNRKPAWTRETKAYGFNQWGQTYPRRNNA